jgi:hypothetical protein
MKYGGEFVATVSLKLLEAVATLSLIVKVTKNSPVSVLRSTGAANKLLGVG